MNQDLTAYYHDRANTYDRVYQIPEEQQDLASASDLFRALFSEKTVLEIACGTGYWTAEIAQTASSVLATDVNENMVEIAKTRCPFENIVFKTADMYTLDVENKFDALFGGFIWSHILLQDLDAFLQKMVSFLQPGSLVAFIDSKPVKGGSHDTKKITQTDAFGNTFQTRTLDNGAQFQVLKNFPTEAFLRQTLSPFLTDLKYTDLEYYWVVSGRLKGGAL